ncbi:unnamed protein product [Fusarium venenatum]|uniref:Uncharacterized protein n=1 Tax=Fusarium venenatum TaxID=56646 RepID=A0A2L2T1T4_9HYPO|nr:uncharacterized protein FVRRES_05869 [Fusarium venenatum]CEI61433.1 unnamed protein product [Fusarium venenatum]
MSSQATLQGSRIPNQIFNKSTNSYTITQQDLEFISDQQLEWSQQWIPDPTFDKKVKDVQDAYDELTLDDGSLFTRGTDAFIEEGAAQEDIASGDALQRYSAPLEAQGPLSDLGYFHHDPITGAELDVVVDADTGDARRRLLPPEPSWLPHSQEQDRMIAASRFSSDRRPRWRYYQYPHRGGLFSPSLCSQKLNSVD